jgi:hypothetical protein
MGKEIKPQRVDYILIDKMLLANMNGKTYKTNLNNSKIIKLIGENYESKVKLQKETT